MMLTTPRKLKEDGREKGRARGRSYNRSALTIVDEVGYTLVSREDCNLFFRFVADRYEKASTVLTSNKAFSDWTEFRSCTTPLSFRSS